MSKAPIHGTLVRIEESIAGLMKEWELFFNGQRKLPPTKEKARLEREFRKLRQEHIADNALRFRMLNLQTRFNTYSEMWNRRMREIEEGPLHFRQRQKMHTTMTRNIEQKEAVGTEKEKKSNGNGKDGGNGKGEGFIIHDPDKDQKPMENLFQRYTKEVERATKRRTTLTLESFSKKIGQQVESIERTKKCDAVAVDISTEDGKVKLKFKPVKE